MLIVIVLFSIMMFAIYFRLNLPGDFLLNRSSTTGNLISITIYVLFFSLIYLMFLIVADMLGIEPPIRYKVAICILMMFALTIELIHVYLPDILKANKILMFIYDNFVDNFIFLEIILLIFLIIMGKKSENKVKRKIAVSFGYVFILRYIFLLFGYLIFAGSGYSQYLVFLIQVLILFSVILLPYLWMKIWFLKYAGGLSDREELQVHMDAVCRKYGISEREREIMLMMVRGKTNKEIEDELFISINTVKNHVYNIFKKLKINSRHQLIKFFNRI